LFFFNTLISEGSLSTAAIISAAIFILVFISISFRLLHETTAALLGAAVILLVTYIAGTFNSDLRILTFEQAMLAVDWNVIFLIMGMMIFMAILGETNVFKWLAYQIFRLGRGNTWLIVVLLITLTGITSALLNNVTAILLIVPLTIQLSLALGISPVAVVIAEVLASNIGGAATLIGDPPSTIVGSHIGLSFSEYLVHMAPVALAGMIALLFFNRLQYRKEYTKGAKKVSPVLIESLAEDSRIEDHATLKKALLVGSFTLLLFFIADVFSQMPPSVVALAGAAVLIAWVRPDLEHMVHEVDWTTLIFFIGLFVIVGGMEATGAIDWLAVRIQLLAAQNLTRAVVLTTWGAGFASGIVDNIPFTVAALPIIDHLTLTIPGAAESGVLYWALILGADFGGNATYIGSAPNIVAVGLLAQAGYRVTFGRFLRDGLPITVITLLIATIWLLLRY
jgi:Na+/H+ antiporter NhaD/arsenite permease-like protein